MFDNKKSLVAKLRDLLADDQAGEIGSEKVELWKREVERYLRETNYTPNNN